MTRDLDFGRKGPAQGQARALIVFLHGYGADGADLLGLADVLGPHLPGVAFVAPDAPERCAGNPYGRQWFPIPWIDGSSEAAAAAGLALAAEDLNAFLDARIAEYGLAPDRVALVGFSQGAMMAMHVAPRRPDPVAGVVAISGRLLEHDRLASEAVSRPPVLLVHGDQDDLVPFANLDFAAEVLARAGFDVYGHVMRGTGHGIAPDGLSVALAFLRDRLA